MVELALALGIALNLILTEVFGLASGGLIVPGYLALHLDQPSRILATLVVGAATWALVRHGWMRCTILYGQRRFGITMLTGFLVQMGYLHILGSIGPVATDLRAVGYLVPGLLAHTALSQGFWPTVAMTAVCTVGTRVCLDLILWLVR